MFGYSEVSSLGHSPAPKSIGMVRRLRPSGYKRWNRRRSKWTSSVGEERDHRFILLDLLGSSRLSTTWTHGVYAKESYAPFGETYNETSTTDRSFTGDDQTTVQGTSNAQGIYDFLFRRQDAAAGRWLSPDPYSGSYDLTDPQSLNRYAYALNRPLDLVDDLGLDCAYFLVRSNYYYQQEYPGAPPTNQSWTFDYLQVCTASNALLPVQSGPEGSGVSIGPTCRSALKAADRSAAAVARANSTWGVLQTAASLKGIPTALLAAIGVRESNFLNVQERLKSGKAGPGMGIFQLTNQPGVSAAQAFGPAYSANYAAGMLAYNMNYLSNAFSFSPAKLLQATADSYNFGLKNIHGNPDTMDKGTTGGDYGSTVVGMMSCFSHP